MKLMSIPFSLNSRTNSLPHLFRRFLVTALPTLFEMDQPHRKVSDLFLLKLTASQCVMWRNCPSSFKSWNSDWRFKDGKLFTADCNCQSFAPFSSSARDDFLSTFSRHTGTKTVSCFSTLSLWLIRSFHLIPLYDLNVRLSWSFWRRRLNHKAL